jgi:hypothetical protein
VTCAMAAGSGAGSTGNGAAGPAVPINAVKRWLAADRPVASLGGGLARWMETIRSCAALLGPSRTRANRHRAGSLFQDSAVSAASASCRARPKQSRRSGRASAEPSPGISRSGSWPTRIQRAGARGRGPRPGRSI